MMKRFSVVLVLSLLAGACGGNVNVATVDGFGLSLSDIPIESEGFDVPREEFLIALNWKVREQILVTAAENEFRIVLDADEVTASAAAILAEVPPEFQANPLANLSYFETLARVAPEFGSLWPLLDEALGDELASANWRNNTLRSAEVEVKKRFGVWRVNPDPRVYPE